jgi:hypothetical protein
MLMEEKAADIFDDIKRQMECGKNFECTESESAVLCKARDFGLKDYIECLEAEPQRCRFAVSFGAAHFCRCSMRVHIAKTVKK